MKSRFKLRFIIGLLLIGLLTSCQMNDKKDDGKTEDVSEQQDKKNNADQNKKDVENNDDSVKVSIDDISIEPVEIKNASGSDDSDIHFRFKNNSKYPIRRLKTTYKQSDNSGEAEYEWSQTVMPGHYSIPDSKEGSPEMSIKEYEYIVYDSGTNYTINYDVENDKYEQSLNTVIDALIIPEDGVKVSFNNFEFSSETDAPDANGNIYTKFKFVNNSDFPIDKLKLFVYNNDKEEVVYYAFNELVESGATSKEIRNPGGDDLTILGARYEFKIDNVIYAYYYDNQLKIYDQVAGPNN